MLNDTHKVQKLEGPVLVPATSSEIQRFVSRPLFSVRHTATAACEFQTHSHSSFVVTVVLAGRFAATIGERTFDLSAGDSALTNVGQLHAASA
ncbi:MAG: AraC family ligand binding domain-containing protein [Blastocatellia bacterium]